MQSSLWYNPQITSEELLYPECVQKGLLLSDNLLFYNGDLLDNNDIGKKFNVDINTFYYHRIKLLLTKLMQKHKCLFF